MYDFDVQLPVSWHTSYILLKESCPRTCSDRLYIFHSHDLRHRWLYKWITRSQSKTLANQGPDNVTKKSCSGELTTKRLEFRELQNDLLVSWNVSLMFYSRVSLIWFVPVVQMLMLCLIHTLRSGKVVLLLHTQDGER